MNTAAASSGPDHPPVADHHQSEPGIILIDKPVGPTSFWVVKQVRRLLGLKKTGHAGTLDPLASGLLIVCAGRPATRIINQLMDGDKEYIATIRLGIETDTQDREGKIIAEQAVPDLQEKEIKDCLAGFVGEQLQAPPRFSALKHKGKPLYYYARRNIEVKKESRWIVIKEIEPISIGPENLTIRVVCGKGTYIRSLATDIGTALGCGAHLAELRRTRSGSFSVTDALDGETLAGDDEEALKHLKEKMLTVDAVSELLG